MMEHLKIGLKTGARNATWPQVVSSGLLEVRPLPISRRDKFFGMGSCFVNEIRHYLEKGGVSVYPMLDEKTQSLFPEELKAVPAWGKWDERVHYQNYTPASIEQEIDMALGDYRLKDAAIVQKGQKFWDPYRRSVYTSSPQGTLEIRRRMNASIAEGIQEAEVAIMTLGSIESFTVKEHGGHVAEFRAHLAHDLDYVEDSYEQTEACLSRICHKLLNRAGFKNIVLTVSPIPMGRTHRDAEVVLQNMYSKSVLRACVESIVRKNENVHYFPSYEFVITRGGFRTTDYLHVRSEIVAEITSAFLASLTD